MPTHDIAYQQRLKIRRTTLGFGVIQVVLGLALTGLSFAAFALSESDRIRNACPYWAGFTVFCSGGVGVVAWRHSTVLSMGLFTFFSAVCVVLHMIGTILTGEVGGLLKSVIICHLSVDDQSCMCCDSIMTCKQNVPTYKFNGVSDCTIVTGILKELMYGLCVLNIFGSLVCFIATILGCTSVARQAGRDQPLFRRRLSTRSESHEHTQYSWLPYPTDLDMLPPYAPPIYRSVDNFQDFGATPYIVPPPVFDPTDLPPPYSSRVASVNGSGMSLNTQCENVHQQRINRENRDRSGGGASLMVTDGGMTISHQYENEYQQRIIRESRSSSSSSSSARVTAAVLTRDGIRELTHRENTNTQRCTNAERLDGNNCEAVCLTTAGEETRNESTYLPSSQRGEGRASGRLAIVDVLGQRMEEITLQLENHVQQLREQADEIRERRNCVRSSGQCTNVGTHANGCRDIEVHNCIAKGQNEGMPQTNLQRLTETEQSVEIISFENEGENKTDDDFKDEQIEENCNCSFILEETLTEEGCGSEEKELNEGTMMCETIEAKDQDKKYNLQCHREEERTSAVRKYDSEPQNLTESEAHLNGNAKHVSGISDFASKTSKNVRDDLITAEVRREESVYCVTGCKYNGLESIGNVNVEGLDDSVSLDSNEDTACPEVYFDSREDESASEYTNDRATNVNENGITGECQSKQTDYARENINCCNEMEEDINSNEILPRGWEIADVRVSDFETLSGCEIADAILDTFGSIATSQNGEPSTCVSNPETRSSNQAFSEQDDCSLLLCTSHVQVCKENQNSDGSSKLLEDTDIFKTNCTETDNIKRHSGAESGIQREGNANFVSYIDQSCHGDVSSEEGIPFISKSNIVDGAGVNLDSGNDPSQLDNQYTATSLPDRQSIDARSSAANTVNNNENTCKNVKVLLNLENISLEKSGEESKGANQCREFPTLFGRLAATESGIRIIENLGFDQSNCRESGRISTNGIASDESKTYSMNVCGVQKSAEEPHKNGYISSLPTTEVNLSQEGDTNQSLMHKNLQNENQVARNIAQGPASELRRKSLDGRKRSLRSRSASSVCHEYMTIPPPNIELPLEIREAGNGFMNNNNVARSRKRSGGDSRKKGSSRSKDGAMKVMQESPRKKDRTPRNKEQGFGHGNDVPGNKNQMRGNKEQSPENGERISKIKERTDRIKRDMPKSKVGTSRNKNDALSPKEENRRMFKELSRNKDETLKHTSSLDKAWNRFKKSKNGHCMLGPPKHSVLPTCSGKEERMSTAEKGVDHQGLQDSTDTLQGMVLSQQGKETVV